MPSSYPSGIDSFTNPDPADALDSVSVPHAGQHSNVNDAIEAIETELGTDPAGAESTVADRFDVIEDDDWVVAARIADGAVGTAHLADDAVTVAKITPGSVGTVLGTTVDGDAVAWRFPGPVNLLGSQQASIPTDTTGWAAYNANTTLTYEGGDGKIAAGCLSCYWNATTLNTGIALAKNTPGVDGYVAVEEGATYTCTAWVKETSGTRGAKIGYYGVDVAVGTATQTDTLRYDTTGAVAAGGASGWTLVSGTFTVTPGTGTNYARFVIFGNATGSAGDVLLVDDICVYRSPSVSRQIEPGGDPVGNPYAGVLWSESVGRRGFLWDNYNSRWQMVYGDTGWRDVSGSLVSGWGGEVLIRRQGFHVTVVVRQLTNTAASDEQFYSIPTGFQPLSIQTVVGMIAYGSSSGATTAYAAGHERVNYNGTSVLNVVAKANYSGAYGSAVLSWDTTQAWPTALPGTASGSIPSA